MVDVIDSGLSGMKEICAFVRRSESTVLKWIREYGMPARKMGGVWVSDRQMIAAWRKAMISEGVILG